MKLFITWSGAQSEVVAECLQEWIHNVIQTVEPWMSKEIARGARWNPEVTGVLEKSNFGIVVLTPENLTAPWVLFEAGALSKIRDSHVATLLVDLKKGDVEYPLAQFQHTLATKEDVLELMKTINGSLKEPQDKKLEEKDLEKTFNHFWPELAEAIEKSRKKRTVTRKPSRTTEQILEDLVDLARQQAKQLSEIETFVDPRTSWWRWPASSGSIITFPAGTTFGTIGYPSSGLVGIGGSAGVEGPAQEGPAQEDTNSQDEPPGPPKK